MNVKGMGFVGIVGNRPLLDRSYPRLEQNRIGKELPSYGKGCVVPTFKRIDGKNRCSVLGNHLIGPRQIDKESLCG